MLGLQYSVFQFGGYSPVIASSLPYQDAGNWSGDFDGTNDIVVAAGSAPQGHPTKPTAAVTLSLWISPEDWDYKDHAGYYSKAYMAGNLATGGFALYFERGSGASGQDTFLKWQIGVEDNGTGSAGYLTAVTTNKIPDSFSGWKHIVGTYDGTTAKLYIDASLSLTTNAAHGVGSAQDIDYSTSGPETQVKEFAIGGSAQHLEFIHAKIDDVAIWSSALTITEIAAIYNSGTPIDVRRSDISGYDSEANLGAYWTFDEGVGGITTEMSGNSSAVGTLQNGIDFSVETPANP
jgi:hypothetical protein